MTWQRHARKAAKILGELDNQEEIPTSSHVVVGNDFDLVEDNLDDMETNTGDNNAIDNSYDGLDISIFNSSVRIYSSDSEQDSDVDDFRPPLDSSSETEESGPNDDASFSDKLAEWMSSNNITHRCGEVPQVQLAENGRTLPIRRNSPIRLNSPELAGEEMRFAAGWLFGPP